ncbi:hypothetical protein J6590_082101 [Homalodisca vitripennis]|nr:hypothetical protein J6590_082101 [Homalodisca vitripennis]
MCENSVDTLQHFKKGIRTVETRAFYLNPVQNGSSLKLIEAKHGSHIQKVNKFNKYNLLYKPVLQGRPPSSY